MGKIIRVCEVLVQAGITIPTSPIITDHILKTACPTCEEPQFLNQCKIFEQDDETHYKCKNGCQVILIVSKPGGESIDGRGYKLKNYVIRNANDLLIVTTNSVVVAFPKSTASLRKDV